MSDGFDVVLPDGVFGGQPTTLDVVLDCTAFRSYIVRVELAVILHQHVCTTSNSVDSGADTAKRMLKAEPARAVNIACDEISVHAKQHRSTRCHYLRTTSATPELSRNTCRLAVDLPFGVCPTISLRTDAVEVEVAYVLLFTAYAADGSRSMATRPLKVLGPHSCVYRHFDKMVQRTTRCAHGRGVSLSCSVPRIVPLDAARTTPLEMRIDVIDGVTLKEVRVTLCTVTIVISDGFPHREVRTHFLKSLDISSSKEEKSKAGNRVIRLSCDLSFGPATVFTTVTSKFLRVSHALVVETVGDVEVRADMDVVVHSPWPDDLLQISTEQTLTAGNVTYYGDVRVGGDTVARGVAVIGEESFIGTWNRGTAVDVQKVNNDACVRIPHVPPIRSFASDGTAAMLSAARTSPLSHTSHIHVPNWVDGHADGFSEPPTADGTPTSVWSTREIEVFLSDAFDRFCGNQRTAESPSCNRLLSPLVSTDFSKTGPINAHSLLGHTRARHLAALCLPPALAREVVDAMILAATSEKDTMTMTMQLAIVNAQQGKFAEAKRTLTSVTVETRNPHTLRDRADAIMYLCVQVVVTVGEAAYDQAVKHCAAIETILTSRTAAPQNTNNNTAMAAGPRSPSRSGKAAPHGAKQHTATEDPSLREISRIYALCAAGMLSCLPTPNHTAQVTHLIEVLSGPSQIFVGTSRDPSTVDAVGFFPDIAVPMLTQTFERAGAASHNHDTHSRLFRYADELLRLGFIRWGVTLRTHLLAFFMRHASRYPVDTERLCGQLLSDLRRLPASLGPTVRVHGAAIALFEGQGDVTRALEHAFTIVDVVARALPSIPRLLKAEVKGLTSCTIGQTSYEPRNIPLRSGEVQTLLQREVHLLKPHHICDNVHVAIEYILQRCPLCTAKKQFLLDALAISECILLDGASGLLTARLCVALSELYGGHMERTSALSFAIRGSRILSIAAQELPDRVLHAHSLYLSSTWSYHLRMLSSSLRYAYYAFEALTKLLAAAGESDAVGDVVGQYSAEITRWVFRLRQQPVASLHEMEVRRHRSGPGAIERWHEKLLLLRHPLLGEQDDGADDDKYVFVDREDEQVGSAGTASLSSPRTKKWVCDEDALDCALCCAPFTFYRRRHHCRQCGNVVCAECSPLLRTIAGYDVPQRVCNRCRKQPSGGKAPPKSN
eukprot:PhM_4_TR808/c0_g1_i1/m.8612